MTATALDRRDLEFQIREVLADSLLVHNRQTGDALEVIYAAADRMASQPLARAFSLVTRLYSDYVDALTWAREHYQPVSPQPDDEEQSLEPMIADPDVRRSLLSRKAMCEGGLALCLYGADLLTQKNEHPEADQQSEAASLFALLAPIMAGWPAQLLPGDEEVGQRARSSARDLLGRAIWRDQSRGLQRLMHCVQADLQATEEEPCQQWVLSLSETLQQAVKVTSSLGKSLVNGDQERVLANAHNYLRLFGYIVVAWMWLRQANAAARALPGASSEADQDFYLGKLQAARYFFHCELPTVAQDLVLLRNQDDTCLVMQPEWF